VTRGSLTSYIAVYALSYLVGYLVLLMPAGLGVREASMVTLLTIARLADPGQAALLAVTSRLWLTVLEIVPGALFLAFDGLRRRPSTMNVDNE
jgi:glycosyltransferase 2 family protein